MVSGVNTLNTNLQHYVKHFEDRMDKNLCDTLVREMNEIQFEQHKFHNAT